MISHRVSVATALVLSAIVHPAISASAAQAAVDPARAEMLDQLGRELRDRYVFADRGNQMALELRKQRSRLLATGDRKEFSAAVQKLLRDSSNDVHITIESAAPQAKSSADPEAARLEEKTKRLQRNDGFIKAEFLDGGIGYLRIDRMESLDDQSAETAVAGIQFLRNAGAVIIDLRRNPGGSGRMNQLLSTYFFSPADEVWLVSNENRSQGTYRQEWTQPYVPGRRLAETPLYILVGGQTGSAAEGFAYNLQARQRAKVVGSATAGGAHSGSSVSLPGGFVAFIPTGRTVNPITTANWEGKGVQPDIATKKNALDAALLAIWQDRGRKPGASAADRENAEWHVRYYEARLNPSAPPDNPARLAGDYEGALQVRLLDGSLYYRTGTAMFRPLLPLSDGTFAMEGYDAYGAGSGRYRFEQDSNGVVTGVTQLIRTAPHSVSEFKDKRVG